MPERTLRDEQSLWAACPFCNIIHGNAPATVVHRWHDALAIVPLNPVIDGHVLVIPHEHVTDYTAIPRISAKTMWRAAEIASHPSNLITSAGREATQTVRHLHIHIVPRRKNDGLILPWTGQARIDATRADTAEAIAWAIEQMQEPALAPAARIAREHAATEGPRS